MDEKKFSLELPLPRSIAILDPKIAEEVIAQLKAELAGVIEPLASEAAKRIVAQRLELLESAQAPKKPGGERLKELNIQPTKGSMIKEEPPAKKSEIAEPTKKACNKCGKDIEISANFCRFCGNRQ